MHKIWGNWPTPYHISTIILHSIVSVLYYFVCQKIVFHPSYEKASLVAGILFALHPIHTEVVSTKVQQPSSIGGFYKKPLFTMNSQTFILQYNLGREVLVINHRAPSASNTTGINVLQCFTQNLKVFGDTSRPLQDLQ